MSDNLETIPTSGEISAPVPYFMRTTQTFEVSTYPNQFMLAILEDGSVKSLGGYLTSEVTNIYELINYQNKKETFYLYAVDNLMKKNNFLQLSIQLDQELISEEEFEEELEKHEAKYLIKMNDSFEEKDFKIVTDILPKLNRSFTVDEVSELFSISMEKIHKCLDLNIKKENT